MTKDEALKMAIEALKQYVDVVGHKFNAETWGDIEDKGNPAREALNACKEALEQPTVAELNDEYLRDTYVEGLNQPAQEPVAWRYKEYSVNGNNGVWRYVTHYTAFNRQGSFEPLYTHPHQWQGLTDDEKKEMWLDTDNISWTAFKETYLLIEQALKDKNT
jgi:hypothetical protein